MATTSSNGVDEGLRFVYEPSSRQVRFNFGNRAGRSSRQTSPSQVTPPTDVIPEVEIMVEEGLGAPSGFNATELKKMQMDLRDEAGTVMRLALLHKSKQDPRYKLPRMSSVSVVLCGDLHIRALNLTHRDKDAATDVLSFEMDDALDYKVHLPMKLLGDVVISLDTARRQARERDHGLLDEVRILLVHGILHLCGFDHERGEEASVVMAGEERRIMDELGWKGEGLIAAAARHSEEDLEDTPSGSSNGSQRGDKAKASTSKEESVGLGSIWIAAGMGGDGGGAVRSKVVRKASEVARSKEPVITRASSSQIRLVALDMDGTLLDAKSQIRPSSVKAIKAACSKGVRVILATGKARPAALSACEKAGLLGPNLLVSTTSPGIFLQGLAIHGSRGESLFSTQLSRKVVKEAFEWSLSSPGVSLVAFHGDDCSTLKMTRDLEDLHSIYCEPLARVMPSIKALIDGPPVKKLLFQASPVEIDGQVRPHWEKLLRGGHGDASLMQAVPHMLEMVPRGVGKWQAVLKLLNHLKMPKEAFMAVGDGGNDMTMVQGASGLGIGVAMKNAVPGVKAVATYVTTQSHDEDGIAEAFEKFVL